MQLLRRNCGREVRPQMTLPLYTQPTVRLVHRGQGARAGALERSLQSRCLQLRLGLRPVKVPRARCSALHLQTALLQK